MPKKSPKAKRVETLQVFYTSVHHIEGEKLIGRVTGWPARKWISGFSTQELRDQLWFHYPEEYQEKITFTPTDEWFSGDPRYREFSPPYEIEEPENAA